jgi:hypothetical protein
MSQISQVNDLIASLLAMTVPGEHFELVSDPTRFTKTTKPRALYVAVTGTATVVDWHGHSESSVTFTTGYHPCNFQKISSISGATIYAVR